MHDFDIILGMDWLAGHHATMECFTKVITFKLDAALVETKFQLRRFSLVRIFPRGKNKLEGKLHFQL